LQYERQGLSAGYIFNQQVRPMSKQLAISAAFSVFAMAAFVLSSTPAHMPTGAKTEAPAPAGIEVLSDLAAIGG
jgi:hypothetical protein